MISPRTTSLAVFTIAMVLNATLCFADRGNAGGATRGYLRHCEVIGLERARRDPKCIEALFEAPEFEGVLENVPALRDGRVSLERLLIQSARRIVSEPGGLPEGDDPNEQDFKGLYERDGRTLVKLTREQLADLENAPERAISPIDLDPKNGPSSLANYPTFPPPDPFPLPQPGFSPPPPNNNDLDVAGFMDDMHAALSNSANGYALKIRQNGQTIGILQWNWARNPDVGDSPARGWNTDRRMHVASMSKLMTAIGLVHLMEATPGVDADDFMLPWLPKYWDKNQGGNSLVTFDNLMNHMSGYSTGGSASDFATMKSNVEAGANAGMVGVTPDYENMNFGLIRILIATIGGYIHPSTNFGLEFMNDLFWDAMTTAAYEDYMQTYVFNPVAAFPVFDTNTETVLAYRWDSGTAGWDSGDLSCCGGGYGWHMTITEILNVVRAFRAGNIVSLGGESDILNRSWGLNSPLNGESTLAGLIYYKPGRWTTNSNRALGRTEQGVVMLLPDDIEIVIFVNSEVSDGMGGFFSLQNLARTVYINNIVPP